MGAFSFGSDHSGYEFSLFSAAHWAALLAVASFFMLLFWWRRQIRHQRFRNVFRFSLIVILIACEVLLQVWYVVNGRWDYHYSLPFELCSLSLMLSIVMLFSRSYRLYEFVYFAGIGGSLMAFLTPDLAFSFPHFRFIHFFVAHAAIVASALFMTIAYGYRPTIKSIFRVMLVLNILMVPVFLFNLWSGSNYMFLMRKPAGGSLLDYLGPWPLYILTMELVALALFFLLYLPFAIRIQSQQENAK